MVVSVTKQPKKREPMRKELHMSSLTMSGRTFARVGVAAGLTTALASGSLAALTEAQAADDHDYESAAEKKIRSHCPECGKMEC